MTDEKQADKDAADPAKHESERLSAPAMEQEQRRQKIQNAVKQDGAGSSDPHETVNPDG